MQLTIWDAIFSSMVIPSGSLTEFLIPGAVVTEKKKKVSWHCVYPLCEWHFWNFKHTRNHYDLRPIFKTEDTLSSPIRTRPKRNWKEMAHWVYSIPSTCGRSHVGETDRPLTMWLHEHRHNFRRGFLEKVKRAQHAYEKGHRVGRVQAWLKATAYNGNTRNRSRWCA
jgi:hypothetical protein